MERTPETMIEATVTINGHEITLVIFECDNCGGALGVDASYIDQHSDEIKCPYCNVTHKVV